jgi:malonyl-CoA/methylmalonyl-CoA synthetase
MTPSLQLLRFAQQYASRVAVIAQRKAHSFLELYHAACRTATALLAGADDLYEARVAFLVPPGFDYVATLLGIWQAGGVAVPLCLQHPPPEWEYVLDDTEAAALMIHAEFADRVRHLAESRSLRVLQFDAMSPSKAVPLPEITADRRALILYTSGTTARPKGVVTTHANLQAQVEALVQAWEWTPHDRILHALPLHHVHGIVNALLCALWVGATCEFLPRFDAMPVWDRFSAGGLTLFMGVPTMYARLIAAWEQAAPAQRQAWSAGAAKLRLMVSGSAALPVATLERWREITGHVLLERYGMTEFGMALSNPLHGQRRPGHVGTSLPGVEARLVDDAGTAVPTGVYGEIEVRGPAVFREYWRQPEATAAAFRDGWFRTGDVAVLEDGSYRILGRQSVDILKTGGYKVSALEIEEVLRTHTAIRECAVVGILDLEWGEQVGACLVLGPGASLTLAELRDWARERLAVYKVPRQLLVVDELPRNAMGKVQKPAVTALFRKSDGPNEELG